MSGDAKLILPNKSLLPGATKADFDELSANHNALSSDYSEFKQNTNTEISRLRQVVNNHGSAIINNKKNEGLVVIELPSSGTFNIAQLMSMKDITSEHKKIAIVNKSTGTINIHWTKTFVATIPGHSLPTNDIITYDLDLQRITTECPVSNTGKVDTSLFSILKNELKTFQLIYETTS